MAGGFLSLPIMRSNRCWAILHVSILAGLLLTLKADSEDSDCDVEVKVHRDTVYEAGLGEDLRINCTVAFCNNPPPTVSWYKLEKTRVTVSVSSHIKMEWKLLNHLEGISFLIFQNILRNDSGVYQCYSEDIVSHNINVSVHVPVIGDGGCTNVSQKNDSNSTILELEPTEDVWMYMYFAAGTVGFVVTVIIISVISMRGCKGKSKKEMQTENQYMAIPMVEQHFPQPSLQPPTRGSPSAPPSRRSTRRKMPPSSQPSELPLPRDSEHVYGKMKEDRERQRNIVEKGGSSIVYAALNHQPPGMAAARPPRPREETSEYAAIRVKDPSPARLNDSKKDDSSH